MLQKKNNKNIFIDGFFSQQLRSQQDKLLEYETWSCGQITRKNESVIATSEAVSLRPQKLPLSLLLFLHFTSLLSLDSALPLFFLFLLLLPLLLGRFHPPSSVNLFSYFALSPLPPFFPSIYSPSCPSFFLSPSYSFSHFFLLCFLSQLFVSFRLVFFIHIVFFPSPQHPLSLLPPISPFSPFSVSS